MEREVEDAGSAASSTEGKLSGPNPAIIGYPQSFDVWLLVAMPLLLIYSDALVTVGVHGGPAERRFYREGTPRGPISRISTKRGAGAVDEITGWAGHTHRDQTDLRYTVYLL